MMEKEKKKNLRRSKRISHFTKKKKNQYPSHIRYKTVSSLLFSFETKKT